MLKELYIENLAVIERVTVDFSDGFTVFTGETGAGKSILIDAINLVLGQRANKDLVRTGASKAVVSAVFCEIPQEIQNMLEQAGYEMDQDELLITRQVMADGKSTARIMGRPATAALLQELGMALVNIHGQHDSQVLLAPEHHLDILDGFAADQDVLEEYRKEYAQYQKLKSEFKQINFDEQEKARKMDLLTYQIEEIDMLNPQPGEDEQLAQQLQVLRNGERINRSLMEAYTALYGYDDAGGGYGEISTACAALTEIEDCGKELESMAEQLSAIQSEIEETAAQISGFLEKFDYDPETLEAAQQRMEDLDSLKRKYGTTIEEVLAFSQTAKEELSAIRFSEQRRSELIQLLEQQKKRVVETGQVLSGLRSQAAVRLCEQVQEQLRFLDMPNVTLQVQQEKAKYGARGCDRVEFLFSTNRGESPKPLGKIASGGELSRIMLALKTVMAQQDSVGTLIFDEIDTGVSGSSAQKIGLKLKEVSQCRQVLCVTHSAQIAALAGSHLLIQKKTQGERTFTGVTALDRNGRIKEVARIMATDQITDLMLQNAEAMIAAYEEK
ncbi:MAG: DNA repair protein RecN [Massiliimalia sp.]